MAAKSEPPVDLYIATYADPKSAEADLDAISDLVEKKVITVEALAFVSRNADGWIDVENRPHDIGVGTAIGAVGGLVVGLIFPPALLLSGLVGAGIGASAGTIVSHANNKEIRAEVEDVLPPGKSGIVAVFEQRWASDVASALAKAEKITKETVDRKSFDQVKIATVGQEDLERQEEAPQ